MERQPTNPSDLEAWVTEIRRLAVPPWRTLVGRITIRETDYGEQALVLAPEQLLPGDAVTRWFLIIRRSLMQGLRVASATSLVPLTDAEIAAILGYVLLEEMPRG